MWDKTGVYPYHRKNLELDKEKSSLINTFNIHKFKDRASSIRIDRGFVVIAAIGFLMSRALLLGELLPFGIAFLGAVAAAKRSVVLFFLPVALGVFTVASQLNLYLSLTSVVALTAILSIYREVLDKHWMIPAVLVFAVNFTVKAVGYTFMEPDIYFWVIALIESLLAGGITVLLCLLVVNKNVRSLTWDKLSPEEMAAVMVICLGVVMGLGEFTIGEMSIRAIISKVAIMIGAFIYGPGVAAIVGALVGVIPMGSNMMTPAFAGILAFSGVLAGVFRQFRKPGVIIGFLLGNLIFTVYLANQATVIVYLVETLIAGGILLITPVNWLNQLSGKEVVPATITGAKIKDDKADDITRQRVWELSQIFREVARTFEESTTISPGANSRALIVENVKNRLCQGCGRYNSCWAINHQETATLIKNAVQQIENTGKFNYRDFPSSLQQRCGQIKELALATACSYDTWQVNNYWQKKLSANTQVIPRQLKGISNIMDDLASKISGQHPKPQYLKNKLLAEVQDRKIPIKSLEINIEREEDLVINITQENCKGKLYCSESLSPIAAEIFSKHFRVKKQVCDFNKNTGNCQYQLCPALQYKIAVGSAQLTKNGSPVSGDTYSLMPLKDGKFGLLLSDGMGSGQKAKLESNTTIALLEHLLESGFDRETAVSTVNSILVLRNQEDTFATLDMAIIDLYSGKLEQTKIGAVPSFLKRGSQVGIIKAGSLPIGILNNVETITAEEQLQVGDILVMISDGVLEANSALLHKEKWVQSLLSKLTTDDPQQIAEQILFQARVLAAENNKDDMTVLVGRIDSRLH